MNDRAREIIKELRADPELAWAVVAWLRVAGPWERCGHRRYERPATRMGILQAHGTTARRLEREDDDARSRGYLLVGGIPGDVDPECGEDCVGWPGQAESTPETARPFRCEAEAGHMGACYGRGVDGVRLGALNAIERRARRERR